jgi:hypothetical protein
MYIQYLSTVDRQKDRAVWDPGVSFSFSCFIIFLLLPSLSGSDSKGRESPWGFPEW